MFFNCKHGEIWMLYRVALLSSLILTTLAQSDSLIANENQADQQKMNANSIISQLDQDDDHRISFIEAMEDLNIAEVFLEMDLNKNGYVSEKELRLYLTHESNQAHHIEKTASLIQL
jgi:Ca2+-binding EF-hand superfamily protein